MLFARHDLHRCFPKGSESARSYYEAHPESREYDERIAALPGIGRNGAGDAPLFEELFAAARSLARESDVDGRPAAARTDLAPEEAARRVKAYARLIGADDVRTGPLRREWVYSHVGRSFGDAEGHEPWGTPVDLSHHPNAIALAFRMDLDFVKSAPEFPTLVATGAAYALGAHVTVRLAEYVRSLGYSARAHHVYNYRVLAVPVAVDCGLGELSRAGFLITKEFGLGVRIGVVTTDLPLSHDGPVDIGVQSFCERCEICAERCPSGAIPFGPKVEHNGIMKWKLDEERCYRYWHTVGTDCSICMATCPWTKPHIWLHRGASRLAAVAGPHQSLMVAGEKLFYGTGTREARGRSQGLASLRPTRLGLHMRFAGAAAVALLALGVWFGADRGLWSAGFQKGAAYSIWLGWLVFGLAVVWSFAAERERRPAGIAVALFGVPAVVAAALAARAGWLGF